MKYRKLVCKFAVIAACASSASIATAAPTLWVVDEGQKLGKIDVATGAVSGVVSTGRTFTDIAFDPAGALWGITFTQLFKINEITGATTLVGNLNAGQQLNALVFGADGTMWAAGSSLFKVNTTSGSSTLVGNTGFQSAGDLAFVNGTMLLSTTSNNLVSLNQTSGVGTSLGSFGTTNVYGLATPDHNTLYGVRGTQVFSVNPVNGASSGFVSYAGQGLGISYGSTFISEAAPIPEPETFGMLLAGLGVVGLVTRRRARRSA